MSVIRCNNSLWLHRVSIGSEYLWLVFGENPWIQMHARYAVGGRTGWWMEDYEEEWMERERNGAEWMDGSRRMEKGVVGIGGGGGGGRGRGGQGGEGLS